VFNTAGVPDGRLMPTGEIAQHDGIQIRVRGLKSTDTFAKANEIWTVASKQVYWNIVDVGAAQYQVYGLTRFTGIIPILIDQPKTKRSIYTINARVTLSQLVYA
jgi:hypothetical protein